MRTHWVLVGQVSVMHWKHAAVIYPGAGTWELPVSREHFCCCCYTPISHCGWLGRCCDAPMSMVPVVIGGWMKGISEVKLGSKLFRSRSKSFKTSTERLFLFLDWYHVTDMPMMLPERHAPTLLDPFFLRPYFPQPPDSAIQASARRPVANQIINTQKPVAFCS